jgi:hypothetical protein
MLVKGFAIACLVLLSSPQVRAQSIHAEDRASDFDSNGVGLTETLLKFAEQQHLSVAIEYVDRDSMNRAIDVILRNETIAQALDSILSHGQGYAWTLGNGIIEIKNRNASKRAEAQLNTVIPVFDIRAGLRVDEASAALESELRVALNPTHQQLGYGGSFMGDSSKIKPATLRNQTVRQILCYIVLNSHAHGWAVAGPPKCLGFTPYCGLWYLMDGKSNGTSYQEVLMKVRANL